MDNTRSDDGVTIAWIKNGALLLLQNNYEESSKCSCKAIQFLKSKMQELAIPSSLGNGPTTIDRETNLLVEFRDSFVDLKNSSSPSSKTVLDNFPNDPRIPPSAEPASPFVCTTVIVISLLPGNKTITRSDNFRLFAAAMYNFALASHLQSLLETSNSAEDTRERLYRCLQCYEVAYLLQVQSQLNMGCILTLSVVNNMGAIYWSLQDPTRSHLCFETLLSLITYFKETGETTRPGSLDCGSGCPINEAAFIGFWTNVTGLVLQPPCSADAA